MWACTIVCISYFAQSRGQSLRGALESLVHSRRLLDAQHSGLVNSSLTHGNVTFSRFLFWWPPYYYTSGVSELLCPQMGSRHTQRSIKRMPMYRPVSVSGMKEWSSLIGSLTIKRWVRIKLDQAIQYHGPRLIPQITRTKSKKTLVDWFGLPPQGLKNSMSTMTIAPNRC